MTRRSSGEKTHRIIIFEDDPSLTKLLFLTLTKEGHSVQTFNDPTACPVYKDHEKECPKDKACADVIITDLMIPNMTGIDFLLLQRERGRKAQDHNKALISVAALTEETRRSSNELGCKFFKKPFKISELIDWVDECAKRVQPF